MKKKIVTVVGARPQFIKAAAVSRVLRAQPALQEILLHTGQHYDNNMSDVFFQELEIPAPDYHFKIGSGSHGAQTGEMLAQIEKVLIQEKPDWVLVYGDTNSTLAGALAAAKLHIPVAHVEAGLRSFNKKMPEEINRIVADQLSEILFIPTEQAKKNLQQEGFSADKIHWTGDVMYDAAIYYGNKAEANSNILKQHYLEPKKYILVTIHRAENTDKKERLVAIMQAFSEVAKDYPIIFPMHPRTKKIVKQYGMSYSNAIKIVEPLGFIDMVMLEKNAALVVTDSGGVQKEAFFYHIPCVTLRDETEWIELVELGWNKIVPPTQADKIAQSIISAMGSHGNMNAKPYGTGNAAEMIMNKLSL